MPSELCLEPISTAHALLSPTADIAAPLSHTDTGVHTNTEGSLTNPGLVFFSWLSLDSSCYTHHFHQWLNTCVLRWQLSQIWPGHAGADIQPPKRYYIFYPDSALAQTQICWEVCYTTKLGEPDNFLGLPRFPRSCLNKLNPTWYLSSVTHTLLLPLRKPALAQQFSCIFYICFPLWTYLDSLVPAPPRYKTAVITTCQWL